MYLSLFSVMGSVETTVAMASSPLDGRLMINSDESDHVR